MNKTHGKTLGKTNIKYKPVNYKSKQTIKYVFPTPIPIAEVSCTIYYEPNEQIEYEEPIQYIIYPNEVPIQIAVALVPKDYYPIDYNYDEYEYYDEEYSEDDEEVIEAFIQMMSLRY